MWEGKKNKKKTNVKKGSRVNKNAREEYIIFLERKGLGGQLRGPLLHQ